MARGTQLGQLVTQLKAETRISSAVSLTVDTEATYKELLRRQQELLYDDYDWPHLRVFLSKALVAGSRYYDFPTDATLGNINLERVEEVVVKYNNHRYDLERGIGFDEYNQYDPDDDERSDPVRKWDMRWTGTKTQIEVWPIPASAQTLRVKGLRELRSLTSNSDVADLDDRLIVLYAAAEILKSREQEDWEEKRAAADSRYDMLKNRMKGTSSMVTYGGGDDFRTATSRGPIIRIA